MVFNLSSDKGLLVEKILCQGVYMPDSGLIVQLRSALMKLSKDTLGQLDIIVSLKMSDAVDDFKARAKHVDKPANRFNDKPTEQEIMSKWKSRK